MVSSLLLMVSSAAAATAPAASDTVVSDHLQSQLIAESTAVAGRSIRLGLLLQHAPHWHTYWANPGDSGLPTRLQWTLPEGVTATPIDWPLPQRFDLGDIVNYGYEGRTLLPVTLHLADSVDGEQLEIGLRARWLICQEECIPGAGDYRLQLPLTDQARPDARWQADFSRAQAQQPSTVDWSARLSRDGEQLVLKLEAAPPGGVEDWQWFPYTPRLVANSATPQWQGSASGGELRWQQSEFFSGLPEQSEWWLVSGTKAYRLIATSESAALSSDPR